MVLTKCDLVERKKLAQQMQYIIDHVDSHAAGLASSLPVLCTSLRRPGPAHKVKRKGLRLAGVELLRKELAGLIPAKWTSDSSSISNDQ